MGSSCRDQPGWPDEFVKNRPKCRYLSQPNFCQN
jgi:hypothetical protein